jgi:glycosyltransferase involved in cell wall biosynthesis
MPKVSIIIPCFNQGQYLAETIESVLTQTYSAFECIIVNDGSTDNSMDRIQALTQKDSRLRYVAQPNKGLSAARNTGISHAKGMYVLLWDADDKFEHTYLAKAVKILEDNPQVGFVPSYVQYFGSENGLWKSSRSGGVELYLLRNNNVACCLIRKKVWETVGGFDETMRDGYEDWDFWLRVTDQGWKCEVLKEPLFLYRKKPSSMLVDAQSRHEELLELIITKNIAIFQRNILTILKETRQTEFRTAQTVRNCTSYRLGNYLIKPATWLTNLVKFKPKKNT